MISTGTSNTVQHYQRIVLTLNLGGDNNQNNIIEHTVHFAGDFNSSLTCLCVRDSDLLDYAGLPFAREFSLHGTSTHSLNADDVRSDMDRRASNIRHVLEDLTASQQQQNSFLVVDGRVDEKVVETAEEDDLIVMAVTPPIQRNIEVAYEKICTIIANRPYDLLLVPRTHQPHAGAVAVLADKAIPSERALQLAFHSAQRRHVGVVFFTASDTELLKAIKKRCDSILAAQIGPAPVLSIHSLNQCLSYPWRCRPCSFMVLELTEALPPLNIIDRALSALHCPILLLRQK
ncbi:MAG: hypothetical protein HQ501_05660 [Rhodospirillales bacterium]|nr:hypothetical protein [Rhodospirillales bacterium]